MGDIGVRNVSRSRLRSRLLICLVIVILFLGDASSSAHGFPVYTEPVKIMPLGNSITVGVPLETGYREPLYFSLVGSGYDVDFVGSQSDGSFPEPEHEGHNGKTAAWINEGINGWLIDHEPNIVLYHIGTNDLRSDTSDPSAVADNVDETLSIVYAFDPEITVILAKIILTRDEPNRNNRIHNFNWLLESKAAYWESEGYPIILVDMENALEYDDYSDNLHPNEQGYWKMVDIWYSALETVFKAPVIDGYTPLTDPTISEGDSQAFSVTYHDPDVGDTVSVQWLLDGSPVGTGDSYTYVSPGGDTGVYTVAVEVSDGDLTDDHTWTLTVGEVTLMLWMPFNDATTPIPDESAYGNDGALSGATWMSDYGGVYSFDGVDDYVEVPPSGTLTGFTEGLTVNVWVRLDTIARRQTIVNKYDTAGNQRGWFIEYRTQGFAFFASPDGATYQWWKGDFTPQAGVWYHLTVVWEANTVPKFYVDGQQVPTIRSGTTSQIYNNVGAPLHIGRSTYAGRYLDGLLDDVRVYSEALTPTEVQQHYYDTEADHT